RRFFLHEKDTFLPLDKRNVRDEAKGLLGYFGEVYRRVGRVMP
ncbi:hypothetical protein HMPREF3185_01629, partial [Porphyromonas somerae]